MHTTRVHCLASLATNNTAYRLHTGRLAYRLALTSDTKTTPAVHSWTFHEENICRCYTLPHIMTNRHYDGKMPLTAPHRRAFHEHALLMLCPVTWIDKPLSLREDAHPCANIDGHFHEHVFWCCSCHFSVELCISDYGRKKKIRTGINKQLYNACIQNQSSDRFRRRWTAT